MNNIKISVIMPVYNTEEEYLKEAIESVLSQTFNNLELIIIDDGSTNNAKEVIATYKDERIKYFYQNNKGAGAARNNGMLKASGKYLLFVDSDDWIDLRTCEKLFKEAEEKELDILFFGIYTYDNKIKKLTVWDDLSLFSNEILNTTFNFSCPEIANKLFRINNTCCAKLFNREFLLNNNLLFFEGLIFEDTEFFFRYFFKAEKIGGIRDNLYFYRQNIDFSVTTNKNEKHLGLIKIFKLIENSLIENNLLDQFKIQFYNYKLSTLSYIYKRVNKNIKNKFKELAKEDLKNSKLTKEEIKQLSNYPQFIYKSFLGRAFWYEVTIFLSKIFRIFYKKQNKAKKTVRVSYSWTGDNTRHNFEIGDVKITTDKVKKCDLFIALNGAKEDINVMAKQAWVFTFEPPIPESSGMFKDKFNYYDRVYTSYPSDGNDNIINTTFLSEWHIGKTYSELLRLKPMPKNNDVIWVTSNLTWLDGHKKRMKFVEYVQKNTDYNLYGVGINPIASKYEVYKDSKYVIGVENTYADDYWTEKLADSYLAYSMPIYYGCPNITKYFPKESMIIIDIEKPEEAQQIIQKAIDEDLYTKNFQYILEARDIVLKQFWVYPFVVNEIKKTDFDSLPYRNFKIPSFIKLHNLILNKLKKIIKPVKKILNI